MPSILELSLKRAQETVERFMRGKPFAERSSVFDSAAYLVTLIDRLCHHRYATAPRRPRAYDHFSPSVSGRLSSHGESTCTTVLVFCNPNSRSWVAVSWQSIQLRTSPAEVTAPPLAVNVP